MRAINRSTSAIKYPEALAPILLHAEHEVLNLVDDAFAVSFDGLDHRRSIWERH
jgi:hypothetical protein